MTKELADKTLSPEVMRGGISKYSQSADIWGLGVILYQMASGGNLPFSATDSDELHKQVAAGQHKSLPDEKFSH